MSAFVSSVSTEIRTYTPGQKLIPFESTNKHTRFGIIDGGPGAGKTILALTIAQAHLDAGGEVFYFPGYDLAPFNENVDHAYNYCRYLSDRYSSFTIIENNSLEALKTVASKPALFIIDEFDLFEQANEGSTATIDEMLYQRHVSVLLVAQKAEQIPGIDALLKHPTFLLFGQRYSHPLGRFLEEIVDVYSAAKSLFRENPLGVNLPRARSVFFCVSDSNAFLVAVPLPQPCEGFARRDQSAL
jgi:hypothetical protein